MAFSQLIFEKFFEKNLWLPLLTCIGEDGDIFTTVFQKVLREFFDGYFHLYTVSCAYFYNLIFENSWFVMAVSVRNKFLSHLYRGRWNGFFNLVNQKFQIYLWVSLTILLHKIVGKRNTCAKFFEGCLHNIGSGKRKNITTFRKIHKMFYFVEPDGIRRRWTILHVVADEKAIFIMVLRNFAKKLMSIG